MYYASALTVLGGLDATPLRSLMSKMVEPTEYGKIFTFTGIASSLAFLITGSLFQEIYVETVATFPGFMYLLTAGLQLLALVGNNAQISCTLRSVIHVRKYNAYQNVIIVDEI